MRTTITIRDDVLKRARQLALARSCTLSDLVEESLQRTLAAPAVALPLEQARIPTFAGRGLQPGVDLDSTAGLLDVMEER
jgi:hypothetical protein